MPGIRMVDASEGVLGIEWIEGKSVRFLLGGGAEGEEEIIEEADDEVVEEDIVEEDPLIDYGVSPGMPSTASFEFPPSHGALPLADEVMQMIGTEIAKMHLADVIHGDLTTSNMMLRHPSSIPSGNAELVRTSSPSLIQSKPDVFTSH